MSTRCIAFDTRYNIPEDVLIKLKTLDPTGNKCLYLDYIYKMYVKGNIGPNTYDEFANLLMLFNDNKTHIKNNDIQEYNLETLRELFSVRLDVKQQREDVDVLYDGPFGTLSIPLSYQASCKLGSGTKWCTASEKSAKDYETYSKHGPLYVWYERNWNKGKLRQLGNRSKKFQFLFETEAFMDETNRY